MIKQTDNTIKSQTDRIINKNPTLFLSYCEKDTVIANIIENELKYQTNDGIKISRYTRIPYKGSFKAFMNSIQKHDFVLCIVSDSYLKSQACMYEVGEIIKDHNFDKKLFFVVLNENDSKYYPIKEDLNAANIYGDVKNRIQYIKYWKKRYEEISKDINEINNPEATSHQIEKLKEVGNIYRNDIGEFLEYLADENGKRFEELYYDNFTDIIKWIFPKWEEKMFFKCKCFSELLFNAIEEICKVTLTDYNQIALSAKISNYETGLVVFADNISENKQKYRLVIMEGLMGYVFATGKIINVNDTKKEPQYFNAVNQTNSELVIPIEFQGNIIGVINSESEQKNYYSENMVKQTCKIVNNLSIMLSRLGYVSNVPYEEIPYIHVEFN